MTILTGGGEMGAGIPADGATLETTDPNRDTSLTRAAIRVQGASSYFEPAHVTEAAEIFFHADWYQNSMAAEAAVVIFYDDADLAVYRLNVTISGVTLTCQAQYKAVDGVTWTNIGTSFNTSLDTLNTLDIRLLSDSVSGLMACYLSGTLRNGTATADLSHIDGVSYYRIRSSNDGYWSQMMLSTESTIGHRLKTVPPTGAGATTDFIGTYAEIDDTVYSDLDFINSATDGQVELFSHSSTIPTGYKVKAVIVTARAKRGSSGPANIQLALRSSGTTYLSGSQALDLGYGAFTYVWEDDPATAAAFTASSIAALQFGVKAIT